MGASLISGAAATWSCILDVVAENNRVASISVWDGTISESGRAVDFTSADFLRVEDGVAAEHWDTVDYVRMYQSFGLLGDDVKDA